MLDQEAYDIFFVQVSITVFICKSKAVLESEFGSSVPVFNFIKDLLNPIKLLMWFKLGVILAVDK